MRGANLGAEIMTTSSNTVEDPMREGSTSRAFGSLERAVAIFLFFPALVVLSLLLLKPPEVSPADAPPEQFSAARAMEHLEVIARAPRVMGTSEHAAARDYIIAQIESHGLEAQVQEDTDAVRRGQTSRVVRVQNVLTRLSGTGGAGTLLLLAHYDSVPGSPGASDDGAGVAALLETLRALRAGPALAADVIFLFTDAEEIGLVGARVFQQRHPWASEVDLVLNFEARGARGPSIMFETGPGTGPLVRRFAALAPRPVASSYSYDVYRMLPNDTDFSVFKQAGKRGFNFAYIYDLAAYHSALDTLERVDLRSLQHHGDYALALTRGLAETDFANLGPERRQIYFNLPLVGLVVYPAGAALPLAILATLGLVVVLALGLRKKRFSARRALLGLLAQPLVLALVTGLLMAVGRGGSSALISGRGHLSHPSLFRLGLVLIALAAAWALATAILRKLGADPFGAGAAVWWALLAVAASLYLPSSSYLLVWPLVFAALSLLVLWRAPRSEAFSLRVAVLLLVLAVPVALLWVPMLSLIGAAFAGGSEVFLGLITGLLASALAPQIELLNRTGRRWAVTGGLLVAGFGLVLWQAATAGYDAQRPLSNTVFYALDTEAAAATWVSWERRTDSWTEQFLTSNAERRPLAGFFNRSYDALQQPAPMLELPAPRVRVVTEGEEAAGDVAVGDLATGDMAEGEPAGEEMPAGDEDLGEPATEAEEPAAAEDAGSSGRRLRLNVGSQRRAAACFLELKSESKILSLSVDGHKVSTGALPGESGWWQAMFYGLPADGFDLEITLSGTSPVSVVAVDRVYGLPEIPGFEVEPRPPGQRPASYRTTDLSLVRAVYTF